MTNKIIVATGNAGKMKEVKEILADLDYEIMSMKEAGVFEDVDETGTTFEENAVLKAKGVAKHLSEDAIVIADDSGLEIDYLNGEPGIYSARYLGHDTSYDYKNSEILKKLDGVKDEDRAARFVCAIAAVFPDGREVVKRATIEGIIGHEIAGENGFGYDPIFFVPEYGCTTAELSADQKNAISHRGKALRAIREELING
ncbi:MAG: XTP/dITP diphosphatase [Lachnospiraceae bacterium]|nr:XTP/dITP diphosphatase [Lachnospiraceae bacterium]